MRYKIGMVSLGCPKNLIDSEVMLADLNDNGYVLTNKPEQADVIIINTCSFIEKAKRESIETILKMAKYKKVGNCKALIAVGCLSEQYKEQLMEEIPELDAIIGTGDYHKIVQTVEKVLSGDKLTVFEHSDAEREGMDKRILSTPSYMAYVKIAEGCNNRCTYCIIPTLRGPYKSRSIDHIVEECVNLGNKGVKEIILIAQDTSYYGIDIYGHRCLPQLLKILDGIETLEWIRILYCYPDNIDDELIETIANSRKICHYLDMPIQHISDDILKRMGRHSRSNDIKNLLNKLRNAIPDIVIRTSLIVGFPGETETDFRILLDFIHQYRLDHVGVFTYSQEEGTKAATMSEQIPEKVKQQRYHQLMNVQQYIAKEKCRERIGHYYKVLIERQKGCWYIGRGYMYAPDIDGLIYFTANQVLQPGQMVNVKIIDARGYDLIGEACL